MQDQTKHISGGCDPQVERAVVLQILRDDHDDGWPRAELATELGYADPTAIGDALAHLEHEGVVELVGETIRASRAAMHLNDLGIIAV